MGVFQDLPSTIIYIAIILALSLFVVAEVLIAYQKFQLKKRCVEELDEYEAKNSKKEDEKGKEQQEGKEL